MNGHWTDRTVSRLPRLSGLVAPALSGPHGATGVPLAKKSRSSSAEPTSIMETGMNLVLNPPLLGFIVGTRAALAFGVGLLLADRIPESRRRRIALTLISIGAATTIPAAIALVRGQDRRRLHPVAP